MRAELRKALEGVARRFRQVHLWGALALCWSAWALIGLAIVMLWSRPGNGVLNAFAALVALSGIACVPIALRSARDLRWVARRIEADYPELGVGLRTAVEEDRAAHPGRLGFLQQAVIGRALDHHRAHGWVETASAGTILGARLAQAATLFALIVVFAALVGRARSGASLDALAADVDPADVEVVPGDAEIERGAALLVVARFPGAVPGAAKLVVAGDVEASSSRAMSRSLEDPTFAARVDSVSNDLAYRVEFEGRATRPFRVRVFDYPELVRTDATLTFPGYTLLGPKTAEDIRHVTAVEGTTLALRCRLNKPVESAKLVDERGQVIPLRPAPDDPRAYGATITLAESHRYKVRLVDRDGRKNKSTAEIAVNVTKNRPPVIAMESPGHDVRVSPVEELRLKAVVADDFGVVRRGVSYTLAGSGPSEIVLDDDAKPPSKKVQAERILDFEALKAAPDQLVTYYVWAEDYGPDGKIRRTDGDMFFAEVRHFEEIFRQGEQPSGSSAANEQAGGGNARQAEELAELQKQIINGTWKVLRRETGAKPTDTLAADGKLLRESQGRAIEQAGGLGEILQDPASKANLEGALRAMKEAALSLGEVAEGPSIASLKPALVAEQAAYQALLKLRAREFEVVRNNSRQRQGGGGSGAGASQRQLNQLELTNDENRFEGQSRAQQAQLSQKEREQSETRQVVSRLRELARRQNDLNERLKELQSALEAAKDEPAKQELQRQLKRLRDQQQQVLRDTDELQERMEREENRERMAEARPQVEQGREHIRQASEALEQGRLPRAVTEGARAGRQLDDVRQDLRKQSSDQFSEDLAEMRDRAKRLDEGQDRLSERLDALKDRPQQTLRDTGERKEVRQGLDRQQGDLQELLERMRRTVQDAEEAEPLLAKNLFDAARKADEQTIPDALKEAGQLADAGFPEDAARSSRHAGEGIDQLREGVERAARSVLGDETAALRRAQGEVEDLADQVNREIAQATGGEVNGRESDPSQKGRDGQDATNRRDPAGQHSQQGEGPGERDAQGKGGQAGRGDQEQADQQKASENQPGSGGPQGRQNQGGPQGRQGRGGRGPLRGGDVPRGDGPRPGDASPREAGRGQAGSTGGGGGVDRTLEGLAGGAAGPGGPIAGEGFRQWSDRMREVEELLDDLAMRAEAARIRDRVRGAREESKRHATPPDWTKLQGLVAEPIRELRDRIAEEVRRRESPDALVPIDRDPVPPRFAEGVRRYYERLGSGR